MATTISSSISVSEAGLQLAALLGALEPLEQGAMGQQLGVEAGGHGRAASWLNVEASIALFWGCANRGKLSRI
jgi:hypothetical protein